MNKRFTKIRLIILIGLFLSACNAVKRVPTNKRLLTKNDIIVNEKSISKEEITNIPVQKPNTKTLGLPFSLLIYNIAKPNPDSSFQAKVLDNPKRFKRLTNLLSKKQVYRLGESFWYKGFHTFLKRTGDAPVLFDDSKTKKSLTRFKGYYFNEGFFRVNGTYSIDTTSYKKSKVIYEITTGKPYIVDSISKRITSPVLDSLYETSKNQSSLKSGVQYKSQNFEEEKNRLVTHFRNNGIYHFQPNDVRFVVDTVNTNYKANVKLAIEEYSYREGDSTMTKPFEIYKISEVNIYTDNVISKDKIMILDSTTYNNFNLYSINKLKFKPKAITDAIFITKGGIYSDNKTNLTSRYLSNLKMFNYPSIQYTEDKRDTLSNSLIVNIFLTPKDKYNFNASLDVTHSNIQDFGITGNVSETVRNLFGGAETLQVGLRANVGNSSQTAIISKNFFNISEIGADIKLGFPRILLPFKTEGIIPKTMIPSTTIGFGFAKQKNIGLDKENLTGSMSYVWNPKRFNTAKFDLVNIQYVRNIRVDRYFNVYNSSYTALNEIAQDYTVNTNYVDDDNNLIIDSGTNGFINDAIGSNPILSVTSTDFDAIKSIDERRKRLTENNLILASNYTFTKTTKTNLFDNTFHVFRTKLELAGSLLSMIMRTTNQPLNTNGKQTIFDVEYSQYAKTEIEFIKHWGLSQNSVFAMRTFVGVAIPFGNSDNIPFSRSYFAGGSNDNRAWQPYSLGPGKSGSVNDFNEANLKIAYNAEYRFKITGNFKGALFVDVGNIWNVLDNVEDTNYTFTGFKSLKDIAVGSGFGIRYDFGFVVARLDMGFKTYNPSYLETKKWFRDYNFANSVFNVGINYPF